MPYSTPVSPIPSPVKETAPSSHGPKPWMHHFYDQDPYHGKKSVLHTPMPTIPRRASSHQRMPNGRPRSPGMIRYASQGHAGPSNSSTSIDFTPTSTPTVDGLPPRRGSPAPHGALSVSGLPNEADGDDRSEDGLGLDISPSPDKAPPSLTRGLKDSMDSTSSVESVLPPTPGDEPTKLPPPVDTPSKVKEEDKENNGASIPFPPFEPPTTHRHLHLVSPRTFSDNHARPILGRRGSGTGRFSGHTASASTSTLDAKLFGTVPSRPSSMIRKKSGEVVKPSLKVRSMSTPDLTRKVEDEDDDDDSSDKGGRAFGDERSKSVRFAGEDDTAPGTLENIVMFMKEQKPVQLGHDEMTETETENDTDASDFVQFRTKKNAAARAIDEAERIIMEGGSRVPRIRVDFSPDARGALIGEQIVLERVDMTSPPAPMALKGTAVARNVSFNKWVAIRFTLDHWQTVSEVSGTHVCHIPASTTDDEGWDRFSFTIKLDDYKRKLEERQLILCLRFSVDGREWWDSNNGLNYNFTFKKAPPRRSGRNSTPPTLGANFSAGLQGARHRSVSPLGGGADMNKAFGVPAKSQQPKGPRDWVFPRFSANMLDDIPRSESPALSPPPAASFMAPAPPDVHTHLSLSKKYCAPTPSSSPNTSLRSEFVDDLVTTPAPMSAMQMVAGHPANLSPPQPPSEHVRAASWSGVQNGSWESFPSSIERLDMHGAPGAPGSALSSRDGSMDSFAEYQEQPSTPRPLSEGESTPVAGSRSPINLPDSDGSTRSSPIFRPLGLKRSTGDLQALLRAAGDESAEEDPTPSSSNLSSPSPRLGLPNDLGSPSPSASTGESSPVNTVSTDGSVLDLTAMDIQVDPVERGRSRELDKRYQELIDKFCFFQSPGATPIDEHPYHHRRPNFTSSGTASPTEFPFGTTSSNSPRLTPTPGQTPHLSAEVFRISGHSSPAAFQLRSPEPIAASSLGPVELGNLTPRPSPPIPAKWAVSPSVATN